MKEKEKDTTLAAILSFIMPGLGQIYAGQLGRGIMIFILVFLGYLCLVIPGLLIWIWNIFDARDQVEKINEDNSK